MSTGTAQFLTTLLTGGTGAAQASCYLYRMATNLARNLITIAAAAMSSAMLSNPAAAGDIEVVVQRTDRAVEVYFAMPAPVLVSAFGLDPAHLTRADGTVPFDELRLGTWDIGDAALEAVATKVDGAPAVFEAMSLMAHPSDAALPMTTPLEAMISIEVCSIPTPEVPLTLDDLRVYVGYIAYVEDPLAEVTFALPPELGATIDVVVRDFTDHDANATYHDSVASDDPLTIAPVTPVTQASLLPGPAAGGLGVLGAVVFGAGLACFRRERRRA